MMPAQWVSMWMRFGPDTHPNDYQDTACKLWWDVTGGNLDDLFFVWLGTFCQLLSLQFSGILVPVIPSSCSVSSARIEIQTATHHFITDIAVAHTGTGPADFYSPAESCCIIKRTAKIGRSGLGRMFVSCVPKIWLDKGRITPAALSSYQTFADQMNVPFHYSFGIVTPIDLRPCLHSLQDNDLTPISSWTALHIPTYLYRRRFRSWP